MNSRVYDPLVGLTGRIDLFKIVPIVNLNRYAYVDNTPLNYLDFTVWYKGYLGMIIIEEGDSIPMNKHITTVMGVKSTATHPRFKTG